MPKKPNNLVATGQDAFGEFEVIRNRPGEEELCIVSDHDPVLMVVYLNAPKLPEGIDVAKTILKQDDGAIGIDCGCYAKFHRQVAHIQDRMKTNA